jgi:hypothetical protein
MPQAEVVVPAWQAPDESQQPNGQVVASQAQVQAPLTQVPPAPQSGLRVHCAPEEQATPASLGPPSHGLVGSPQPPSTSGWQVPFASQV